MKREAVNSEFTNYMFCLITLNILIKLFFFPEQCAWWKWWACGRAGLILDAVQNLLGKTGAGEIVMARVLVGSSDIGGTDHNINAENGTF